MTTIDYALMRRLTRRHAEALVAAEMERERREAISRDTAA